MNKREFAIESGASLGAMFVTGLIISVMIVVAWWPISAPLENKIRWELYHKMENATHLANDILKGIADVGR
jgi:hypothetical protein